MKIKKKILFIINPISGRHLQKTRVKSLQKLLDPSKFDISVVYTEFSGHASQLAQNAVTNQTDIVVAVGGDGTINEIASQLVHTNSALAIVPCGSGNGLARDLKISLRINRAVRQINTLNIRQIDVGVCNNQYFFSLTGVGFDAKVANSFNRGKNRKFWGYVCAILKEYFSSTEQCFEIVCDEDHLLDSFFFVTISNCSQWGYGVKVAPNAKIDDGIFHIALCKKPPIFSIIPFVIRILSGKINRSKYIANKTARKIILSAKSGFHYHFDGDFKGVLPQIEVDILHKALNIVAK